MLDGELSPDKKQALRDHLRTCSSCAQYYTQMAEMIGATREEDPVPPEDFRARWKQAVTAEASRSHRETRSSRRPRTAWKPARVLPILACSILAVFVVSTALVNPQAFGLGGESLRSEQATVMPTDASLAREADAAESHSPIIFGTVVTPTRVPKPAMQNEEYWEETFWSSATASQVVTGDIEDVNDAPEDPSSDEEETPEEIEEATEFVAPGAATVAAMRSYAVDIAGMTVTDDEQGILVEGAPDDISLFLVAFGFEAPEDLSRVYITYDHAG